MTVDQARLVFTADIGKAVITEFATEEIGDMVIDIAAQHDPRAQDLRRGALGEVRANQIDVRYSCLLTFLSNK
ncbi:hypothetical protein, partial [Acidithiobacillus caldus]